MHHFVGHHAVIPADAASRELQFMQPVIQLKTGLRGLRTRGLASMSAPLDRNSNACDHALDTFALRRVSFE